MTFSFRRVYFGMVDYWQGSSKIALYVYPSNISTYNDLVEELDDECEMIFEEFKDRYGLSDNDANNALDNALQALRDSVGEDIEDVAFPDLEMEEDSDSPALIFVIEED